MTESLRIRKNTHGAFFDLLPRGIKSYSPFAVRQKGCFCRGGLAYCGNGVDGGKRVYAIIAPRKNQRQGGIRMNPFNLILIIAALLMSGALWGHMPLIVGRSTGKPELGRLGMLCSICGNLVFLGMPCAVGFLIAILVRKADIHVRTGPERRIQPPPPAQASTPGILHLSCLSGPLRGQVYPLGTAGLVIGRGPACGLRLPEGTPGISSQHCCIRYQQGVPVLIDLNSSFGTYLGDGRKLPPNYPVPVAAGSRFYLGSTNCLFQLTLQ